MDEILFRYERIDPTSWAYLASLLAPALYFKFSRFWSVRNADLIGLILLAPALLLVQYGLDHGAVGRAGDIEHIGHIWLFSVHGLFLLRLLLDATMVRRPLLEPNLTAGGLTFLGVSLFLFLAVNVALGNPEPVDRSAASSAAAPHEDRPDALALHGPGFPTIFHLPHIATRAPINRADEPDAPETIVADDTEIDNTNHEEEPSTSEPLDVTERGQVAGETDAADSPESIPETDPEREEEPPTEEAAMAEEIEFPWHYTLAARITAITLQLAIVIGLVFVGLSHFDNVKTGIAAATLYLLLPYTAMWTGSVVHALPAAIVLWAIVWYRRPLLAGAMLGLACGMMFYPFFLLPLWISFYWRRGLRRFLIGAAVTIGLLVAAWALLSSDMDSFVAGLRQMFGLRFPVGADDAVSGAWKYWDPIFRYPILSAFALLSLTLILWPAQKNLGTLIAYSAALMLATQFWHAHSDGIALGWYLPLLLLTMFRPNLEDRTAAAVVR